MTTMTKFLAFTAIFFCCLITFNLWVLAKAGPGQIFADPLLSLSQILALESTVLITLALFLTTKTLFLDRIFVGLDAVYRLHRVLGGIAFVLIVNHPLLLAAKVIKQPLIAQMYLVPGSNLVYNLGIFSVYSFILAFIFVVFIKLPYSAWTFTHRLLGLAFLLGASHTLFIGSDMANFAVLRLWIGGFITLGLGSLIYTIFLYRRFGPRYDYEINGIEREQDIISIWLKPGLKSLKFHPGQFLFAKFCRPGLSGEMHPFSISSGNCEGCIRLSIKILGDYTLRLRELEIGDKAFLYGPYGSFGRSYVSGLGNQCWVAGGIGVTPFLSMLRNEAVNQTDRKIRFFYCFRNPNESNFIGEIRSLSQNTDNVQFVDWCSKERGRLSGRAIMENVEGLRDNKILLCGPPQMMHGLKKQLTELGIEENRIIYEKFKII